MSLQLFFKVFAVCLLLCIITSKAMAGETASTSEVKLDAADQLFMQIWMPVVYGQIGKRPAVQRLLDSATPFHDEKVDLNARSEWIRTQVQSLNPEQKLRFAFLSALHLPSDGSKTIEYGVDMFGKDCGKIGKALLELPPSEIEDIVRWSGLDQSRADAFFRIAKRWSLQ